MILEVYERKYEVMSESFAGHIQGDPTRVLTTSTPVRGSTSGAPVNTRGGGNPGGGSFAGEARVGEESASSRGKGGKGPSPSSVKRRRVYVGIGVLCVVVVACVAVVAVTVHMRSEASMLREARADYAKAVTVEAGVKSDLDAALATAGGLSEGCTDKVADPNVCDMLAAAMSEAQTLNLTDAINAESASKDVLDKTLSKLKENTKALEDASGKLNDANSAVQASIDAKALTGELDALNAALGSAEGTLTQARDLIGSTEGQVADEATRHGLQASVDTLQGAVDAGRNLTGSTDTAAVSAAKEAINTALTAVNNGIGQVQASQAAWTAAHTPATSGSSQVSTPARSGQSRTSRGTSSTPGSSGSRSSTGGTYTGGSSGGSTGGGSNSGGSGGGWIDNGWDWEWEEVSDCGDSHGNAWIC